MNEEYSYTPFLGLSSLRPELIPRAPSTSSWQFSSFTTSTRTLILVWAELLGADAGLSSVVFGLDGQPVLVDLKKAQWREVHVNTTLRQVQSATAIGTRKPARVDEWVLFLQQNDTTGIMTLSSTYLLPEKVLQNIENRLRSEARRAESSGNDSKPLQSSLEKPQLSIVNPNPKLIEGPPFLHKLINFRRNADRIAIDYLGPHQTKQRLTYCEVDELSTALSMQIANALQHADVQGSNAIPLIIPQCPELYIACLAILKAGYAFCPLNLDAPLERIKLIVNDVNAKILLTTNALKDQFTLVGRHVRILAVDEPALDVALTKDSLSRLANPEKLAYVMYTSGSSGTPKGVGISHRAVSQALLAHEEHVPHFKRFLQFAAPTFDVSVFETFFPLMRGATLVCCAREAMLGDLVSAMTRLEVDAAELTPTVAGTLLKNRDAVPSLRVLLTIGEMLTGNVVDEFGYTGNDDGILYGMYGPTEATIHCTIAPKFNRNSRVGTIGVPLSTVSAFVLSIPDDTSSTSDISISPQGVVGELAVGGYQLANEYINRPEQTKTAFVDLHGYGRVYRTGDKARLNADGLLECLGRISDGQVKLRGQRVELGEIENLVYRIKGVSHAMCSVLKGVLVLFCLVEGERVSVEGIRNLYKLWLPGFMRPNEIVLLRDAPRLPSGKLDRRAIERNHELTQSRPKVTTDDLVNDLERRVAEILTEELGVCPGRHESLASQGLDSLKAIKVASRLRSYGLSISVPNLLTADTIANAAKYEKDTSSVPVRPLEAHAIDSLQNQIQQVSPHLLADPHAEKVLPCSPLQFAMLSETAQSASANKNKIEMKFIRPFTFDDIKIAFQKFALANDMMRSGFVAADIPTQPFVRVVWRNLHDSQFHSDLPNDTHLSEIRHSLPLSHPLEFFFDATNLRIIILIHHALYDQWSWDMLKDDLEDILSGQPPVQRPQFDNVAKSLMTYPYRQEYHIAEDYWREQLHDAPLLPFPCLHHHKDHGLGTASVSRELHLTTARLNEVSQGLHIGRPSLVSAAYGLLLTSYLGSTDIIFGTVSSGRSLQINGIEQIFGPCISTLPLRIDVSHLRNARDLMMLVHRSSREMLRHEELGLHRIQQLSNRKGGHRLFDTLFVWQESFFTNARQGPVATVVDNTDFLEFALLLEVEPLFDKLMAKATFRQSVMPREQAEMFLGQFDQIVMILSQAVDISLQNMYGKLPQELLSVEHPQSKRLPRTELDPKPLRATSITTNGTLDDSHYSKTSSGAWSVNLEQPHHIAIEFVNDFNSQSHRCKATRLSYQQLENNAVLLAHRLVERGVERGNLVGILMEKSAELYASIVAVLKSGAGYFPIDPKNPSDRICSAFSEANVKCIITPPAQLAKLKRLSIRPSILHPKLDLSVASIPQISSRSRLPFHVDSEYPAYAISTSGTTGIPKTMVISRRNISANLEVLSSIYQFDSKSKYLQSCSLTFDVSVFDILFTFQNGLCLCSATNDVLFRDIEGLIRSLEVTHLSMTSSVAALIDPIQVPSVKCLITAGEVLSSKVQDAWAGRGLSQGYGPSEATNICALRQNVQEEDFPNNIGHALPSTSLYVSCLDDFAPLPRGAIGELCVGGEQVFKGYIKRPDLMSQKIVEHPHWGRIYRTGDMVRVLTDGSFCFLGREDDQLKLRGQRIELGEINNTVLNVAGVVSCSTLVLSSQSNGSSELVSFCTLERADGGERTASQIFEVLSGRLAAYMVPGDIVFLDSMPITETGKVDRKALKAHFETARSTGDSIFSRENTPDGADEVSSDLEESLRKLVAQVTGSSISSVRRKTSLFRAGLDSINTVLLSTKIREHLSVQIDVSSILANPTIEKLAGLIQLTQQSGAGTLDGSRNLTNRLRSHSPSTKGDIFDVDFQTSVYHTVSSLGLKVDEILPCTPLQESMLTRLNQSQATSYQNQVTFDIFVQEQDLHLGWTKALARHRILRTGFVPTNNPRFAFAQVVLEDFDLPWHRVDSMAPAWNEAGIGPQNNARSLGDFIQPPYSLTFITSAEKGQHSQLVLNMHHALYDAEAMSIILKDVQNLAVRGTGVSFTPFDTYIRYMVELDLSEVDSFWSNYLGEINPCRIFGIDHEFIDKQSPNPRSQQHKSEVSLSDVEEVARKIGVTVVCIYQAAWAQVLSNTTDSSEVCFGNVYSGRNLAIEGAPTITGPCFNTLPLRAELSDSTNSVDLAQKFHASNLEILPFQPSSLRRIQNLWNNGQSLFDTLLLVQNDELTLNTQVWDIASEHGAMDFPMICEVVPNHDHNSLSVNFHWYGDLLSSSDEMLLFECFDRILDNTMRYPSSLVRTSMQLLTDTLPIFKRTRRNSKKNSRKAQDRSIAEEKSTDHDQWPEEDSVARNIISNLSGVQASDISRRTTIFGLGLDSINAFQIVAALGKGGYHLSAADLIEAASVAKIGQLMRQNLSKSIRATSFDFHRFENDHRNQAACDLGIAEDQIKVIRPCTPTQCGILSHFVQSEGKLYCNEMSYLLQPDLDIDKLKRAWAESMARHEMLRTGFFSIDDPKYPFAMITYVPGSRQVPWHTSSSNFPDPKQLHIPPWQLRVAYEGGNTLLSLTMLHALYDATALEGILTDVVAIYKGQDLVAPRSILPAIASFLPENLDESNEAQEFWRRYGEGFQATKFPNLRTDTLKDSSFGSVSRICSLSHSILAKGCRDLGVTLQIAGQCAWARLLSALVGEERIAFGLVLSGRGADEVDEGPVVFPCVNTLPLSVEVTGSTRSLMQTLSNLTVSLMKRQNTASNHIKKLARLDGDLFDSIFIYQKISTEEVYEPPLWKLIGEKATAEYAMSVEVIPTGNDALKLQLTFRRDTVSDEQAYILIEQFHDTLSNSIFAPDQKCRSFKFLDASRLSRIPAKEERIESNVCLLHEFVQRSAESFPERVALEFANSINDEKVEKSTWTYKGLDTEGNKIANLLLDHGVQQGSIVAVCFDKCPEASFSILGILKAGCAYVPLDPTSPPARKHFILDDAACNVILTTSDKVVELRDLSRSSVIAVDQALARGRLLSKRPRLERTISPDDVCYCLFTSGSTGIPKGCEITHDNVVQAMLAFQRLFKGHWNSQSRWLQFASFHFDVSVLEQYWSWSVGICVTSAPRDLLLEDLPGAIRTLHITHIDLTPSLARLVSPDDVPSLCQGVFITGGEQLRQEVLDSWGDQAVIYNGYGPTEATIGCTMFTRVPKDAKTSDIGPQFDNVGSYVLDPKTQEVVPKGAVGELCVSGPLVGRGYRNRVELTRDKFEYLEEDSQRIYHTGDLVRLLHNDHFDFLTRIDDQVKLRGQRLEIGEINHVLRQSSESINELATSVLKHPQQPKEQLVSFVAIGRLRERYEKPSLLAGEQSEKLRQSLHNSAIEQLPSYMVPTNILILDFIPLSPNNKVDIKALKAFYDSLSVESLQSAVRKTGNFRGPNSSTLQTVLTVLKRFTQATKVNPQSNFLELGLDSISAIAFSRALRSHGLETSPALVMKYPTVESLAFSLSDSGFRDSLSNAQHLARQRIRAFAHRHLSSVSQTLQVKPTKVERLSPCTPLQEGIILNTLESDKPLYFSLFAFSLHSSLDLEALQKTWDKVVQENEVLRTRFVLTDDGYAQVVMRKLMETHVSQTTITDGANVKSWIMNKHMEWSHRHKTLEGKLWNVWFVDHQTGPIMCLQIFHALYDGISLSMILNDIAEIYHGRPRRTKRPTYHEMLPLGPLLNVNGAKQYWTARLQQCRPLGFESPQANDSPTATITSRFACAKTIQSLRSRLNVTEPAIFLACWLLALQRHFHFVPTIGVVLSGRTIHEEGAEQVSGPMFNTVPVHIDPINGSSISSFILKCHEYNVSLMQYQHTPLRDIIRWCDGGPDSVLFDSIFVFQKKAVEDDVGEKPWSLAFSNSETEYPLAIEMQQEREGSISLTLQFNAASLDHEVASRLAGYVEEYFDEAVKNPALTISAAQVPANSSVAVPSDVAGTQVANENENSFEWSDSAIKIRKEIALLANLEIEGVSADISIMELGLDSIDAIRLSARLKRNGVNLSVSQIVRDRTIRKLAANNPSLMTPFTIGNEKPYASRLQEMTLQLREALENQGVETGAYEEILPATSLQEGMIAKMLSSDFEEYYNHDVLELHNTTDLNTLHDSWERTVADNGILRTRFIPVEDPRSPFAFAQAILSPLRLDWDSIEISEESGIQDLIRKIKGDAQNDGLKGQMFRLTHVSLGPKHYLIMTAAHATFDGWSMNLIHADIARLCAGQRIQNHPPYRIALENIFASPEMSASHFWSSQLSGLSSSVIPVTGSAESRVMRQELKSRYRATHVLSFRRKQGVTSQTVGILCWAMLLAWHVKQLDVSFGLVLSCRDTEESGDIVFPMMNTVLFRAILHGTSSEMLQYIQDVSAKITEFQHYPLSKAVKNNSRNPDDLFNTLFIYQKRPVSSIEHPPPYRSIGGSSKTEFPVNIELEIIGEDVVWRVAYDESVTETISLRNLDTILELVTERPDQDVYKMANGRILIGELPPFRLGQPRNARESVDLTRQDLDTDANDGPWTEDEQAVRSALSSVANTPEQEITKSSNLFHLGLDSISAIKVSALLRKTSLKLSVSDMLRAATVRQMAERIQPISTTSQKQNNVQASTLVRRMASNVPWQRVGVEPANVERILPATPFQCYALIMCQKSAGRLFDSSFAYKLSRKVSPQDLQLAWDLVIQEFPILRTVFVPTGQSDPAFIQLVLRKTNNPITWLKDKERYMAPLAPQDPPVRLLASSNSDRTIIKLEIHHALYDAVSLSLIISSFERHCNQTGSRGELNQNFEQYLEQLRIGSPSPEQKAFWSEYLEGTSTSVTTNGANGFQSTEISELWKPGLIDNTSPLEEKARQLGLSFQSVFIAVLAVVLRSDSPRTNLHHPEEVVLGVYLANRSLDVESVSQLAAPTVNIVPLRVKAPANISIQDIARQVQADLSEISRAEHCGVALHNITQWTGVRIDCTINFLKLPEMEENTSTGGNLVSFSKIEEIDQDECLVVKSQEYKRDSMWSVPSSVADAYVPSLDVEASVTGGRLNIGLFDSSTSSGEGDLEKMARSLCSLLREL